MSFIAWMGALVTSLGLMAAVSGCQTAQPAFGDPDFPQQIPAAPTQSSVQAPPANSTAPAASTAGVPATAATTNSESLVLREGDAVRISFPGAPNLDTVQQIRRDGKIALKLVGEFQAAGLTPSAMEKELIKLYGPQLQTKEVTVAVESSAFPVYVTGAVLRPGKIISDRPLTALEAIMEAGGFDYTKANLKKVNVIRHENGRTEHFKLNLKGVLQGGETEQFNLKPSDIIYVPERFTWF